MTREEVIKIIECEKCHCEIHPNDIYKDAGDENK